MLTRSSIARTAALALALTVGIAFSAGGASAAECQLRNLGFTGILNDGRLVINAELWNPASNTQIGYLANSTYCRVNTTYGAISAATCQAWHSIATAAMLSAKKIYIVADACTAGNGINLQNISMFGLNH